MLIHAHRSRVLSANYSNSAIRLMDCLPDRPLGLHLHLKFLRVLLGDRLWLLHLQLRPMILLLAHPTILLLDHPTTHLLDHPIPIWPR